MFFNQNEKKLIKDLIFVVYTNIHKNDKRVVSTMMNLFEIIFKVTKNLKEDEYELLDVELSNIIEDDINYFIDEFIIACLNTAQYDNALFIINELTKFKLIEKDSLIHDQASFYARSNNFKKAESLLNKFLEKDPNDIWTYIKLGDIYYHDTSLKEHRNYKKAEAWYYKAYDNKIGYENEDDWVVLLERLGSVTVDRLRHDAEQELLKCLQENKIGGLETIFDLKKDINILGSESITFRHLEYMILKKFNNIDKANNILQILNQFYNLTEQEELDDLSPFEMSHFLPKGRNELRIINEMTEEAQSRLENYDENAMSLFYQAFSDFQKEYLIQEDKVTGRIRQELISEEREKTKKDFDNNLIIWEGFTEFRL